MAINEKGLSELAKMLAPKAPKAPVQIAATQAAAKEKEELKKALEEEGGADPAGGSDPEPEGGADPAGGADPES